MECRTRHGAAGEGRVGGHVPVGALLTRKSVFDKSSIKWIRAVVHGSTCKKRSGDGGRYQRSSDEAERLVEQGAKPAPNSIGVTRMVRLRMLRKCAARD